MEHVRGKRRATDAERPEDRTPSGPRSQEATERVLALQRTAGNQAVVRALTTGHGPAVQRYVADFQADTELVDPPATDLKAVLNDNAPSFQETSGELEDAVEATLYDPLKRTREVPTSIYALLGGGVDEGLARDNGPSGRIGRLGADEFYIRRGMWETHEGGHLIPHHLFDKDDNASDSADGYENLVPMTRQVNMDGWKEKESAIDAKLSSMPAGDQLEVTIPITADQYAVTLNDLATRFGLHVVNNGGKRVKLYEWIPSSIGPVNMRHVETMSEDDLSAAEDNALRKPFPMLKTGADALQALIKLGIPMSQGLMGALAGMK